MNRKRNSIHMNPRLLSAEMPENNDLIRLFELITLNDRFDLVVVPKTKKIKKDLPQITDMSSDVDQISAEDRNEPKLISLERQIKEMSKKIDQLHAIIHNQCILKEQSPYIN